MAGSHRPMRPQRFSRFSGLAASHCIWTQFSASDGIDDASTIYFSEGRGLGRRSPSRIQLGVQLERTFCRILWAIEPYALPSFSRELDEPARLLESRAFRLR